MKIIILILFIVTITYSQDFSLNVFSMRKETVDGKFKKFKGLANRKGEIVLEANYDEIKFDSKEGIGIIVQNGKHGFFRYDGSIILSPKYLNSIYASHGYAWIKNEAGWGLFNIKNKQVVIEPQYQGILDPDEWIEGKDYRAIKNDKIGMINGLGEIILDFKYQSICHLYKKLYKVKQNDLWGFVKENGVVFIEPKYKELSDFINDKALALTNNNELILIDRKGNKLSEFNEFPISNGTTKLVLPEPNEDDEIGSYLKRVFYSKKYERFDFLNCTNEKSFSHSYCKLNYGIILKSLYGWDYSLHKYRIPSYSLKEATSLFEKLIKNTDYKSSKKDGIYYLHSEINWGTHYEIEDLGNNIIEIRVENSI